MIGPSDEELEQFFQLKKEGLTHREIAHITGKSYYSVKEYLRNYPPYAKWSAERKKSFRKREKEIAAMYDSGLTGREIARRIGERKQIVSNVIHTVLAKRSEEENFTGFSSWQLRNTIFVSDVERFKAMTNIGDELVYDETEYGIPLMCRIEKKYPHFAMTDAGDIDWVTLTIKNRKVIGK